MWMMGWFSGTIVDEMSDLSANCRLVATTDGREGWLRCTLGSLIPGVCVAMTFSMNLTQAIRTPSFND
jgi:hypothetical protein